MLRNGLDMRLVPTWVHVKTARLAFSIGIFFYDPAIIHMGRPYNYATAYDVMHELDRPGT